MTARQTFHTPSFGDEEFEILTTPSSFVETHQSNIISSTPDLSLSSSSIIASPPSTTLLQSLPVVTNQPTINNQWQFQVQQQYIPSGSIDNSEYHSAMISTGNSAVISDEIDAGKFNTTTITTTSSGIFSNEDAVSKLKNKPNEKPLSAYALFFRDTQKAIKGQNPDVSFPEISKIVASMWDALDPEHKNVYKKKAEVAKKNFFKKIAAKSDEISVPSPHIQQKLQQDNNEIMVQNNFNTFNSINTSSNVTGANNIMVTSTLPPTKDCLIITNLSSHNSSNQQHLRVNEAIPHNSNVSSMSPSQSQSTLLQSSVSDNTSINLDQNKPLKCIRDGCSNPPIIHPDWEDEYCSNECVVIHCRNVFSHWVNSNLQQQSGESFQAAV